MRQPWGCRAAVLFIFILDVPLAWSWTRDIVPCRWRVGLTGLSASKGKGKEESLLKLDQFLKAADLVGTGGEAKMLIKGEGVLVNGELETRRGRKLFPGDVVTIDDQDFDVAETLAVDYDAVDDPYRDEAEETGEIFYDDPPSVDFNAVDSPFEGEELETAEEILDEAATEDVDLDLANIDDIDLDDEDDIAGDDEGFDELEEEEEGAVASADGSVRVLTRTGLQITCRRASPADLASLASLTWAPPAALRDAEIDGRAESWACAILDRGFGGVVAAMKAPLPGPDNDPVVLSSLVVAPSSRQRGVGGALVDFAMATFPEDTKVAARVPRYKNKEATKKMRGFFTKRGIDMAQQP